MSEVSLFSFIQAEASVAHILFHSHTRIRSMLIYTYRMHRSLGRCTDPPSCPSLRIPVNTRNSGYLVPGFGYLPLSLPLA